jgi:hypothetical protein
MEMYKYLEINFLMILIIIIKKAKNGKKWQK